MTQAFPLFRRRTSTYTPPTPQMLKQFEVIEQQVKAIQHLNGVAEAIIVLLHEKAGGASQGHDFHF